jgi:hypothetical protein
MEKITLKYCRELIREHLSSVPYNIMTDGGEITPNLLKDILSVATSESRFKIDLDEEDEDFSWDLVGPGVSYGMIWWGERLDAEEGRDAMNRILRSHFGPSTRRVEYSSEAHLTKSIMEGDCCPACGSNDLEISCRSFKSATLRVQKSCNRCCSEWDSIYALKGYANLRTD